MTDTQLQQQFLTDHATLRGKAGVLRSLALQVMRGDEELVSAMRLKGEDLQMQLLDHMRWEEDSILPLLRRLEDSTVYSAEAFLEEHASQRAFLKKSLAALRARRGSPTDAASTMLELVDWLERDMDAEETHVMCVFASVAPEG